MKSRNVFMIYVMSAAIIFSGCKSMSKTASGALIGSGAGAAVGAGIGALIGKDAKSAGIGAAIGTAVGATTGAIIGNKMDKAAQEAAAIEGAKVETTTDINGLPAVRVTFESGILFETNKSTLNAASKDALTKFAQIMIKNPTMDIAIIGHTDNTGSLELNQKLSQERAQAVANFLKSQGVPASQIKDVIGKNFSEPVADNSTAAGRAANRRVEVYMYASEQMIKEAEQQSQK
jgi:outer membrane protein OmpA-like peptidoglycan-associated protein